MISVDVLEAETGTTDDGTYTDLIVRATAFVSNQTGRYFGTPVEETYYLEGTGRRDLWLPEKPWEDSAQEIPTVNERMRPGDTATELEAETDYSLRVIGNDAKLVRLAGYVWQVATDGQPYEYEVTLTQGYPEDEGPGDVRQLVIDLCSLKINGRGSEGIRSESLAGGEYSYTRFGAEDLAAIPGADTTLEHWKRHVIA